MKWRTTRKDVIRFGAIICLTVTAGAIASLAVHRIATRTTFKQNQVTRTLATARSKWRVMHILSPEYECSLHVITHLLQREALSNLEEQIILIQSRDNTSVQQDLRATGFEIAVVEPETLGDQYGVLSVPWMIVRNETDKLLYSGGYSAKRIQSAAEVLDIPLLNALRSGPRVQPFPSNECDESQRLKDLFDPFHFAR